MQIRLAFMISALIIFSCVHQDLQLPEPFSSTSNASQVYIIRENRFFGFGIPLTVMFDDAIICRLQEGEYVTFGVEPGIHTLGLSHATATMPFEAKQNYYFLVSTSDDKFGFEIERVDDERGAYFVSISNLLE